MSQAFPAFPDLACHLERLGLFRIRPELGRLREVLARLDLPRRGYTVQIAGTNGKGSTSAFLASLSMAAGLRTGLYTSPHFVSFRERIRLDGKPVSEETLLPPANRIMAAGGGTLTYFEFVTALAAVVFAEANLDLAVMETGLGGTWDAVTALPADLVLFTPIGLDHCAILGDSVAAIAKDKAGAMRPGKPAISAPQVPDAAHALAEAAAEKNVHLAFSGGLETLPESIRTGQRPLLLQGDHQYTNAALALAAWQQVLHERTTTTIPAPPLGSKAGTQQAPCAAYGVAAQALLNDEAVISGLCNAFIPGRLQSTPHAPKQGHPALLLDGAHNVHGITALSAALARYGIAPAAVIFSCLDDKDPAAMAAHIRVLSGGPVFIPPIAHNPRAMNPEALARIVGLAAIPAPDLPAALNMAAAHVAERFPGEDPQQHPVLLCGSLYLLGEFFALRPECLEPPCNTTAVQSNSAAEYAKHPQKS